MSKMALGSTAGGPNYSQRKDLTPEYSLLSPKSSEYTTSAAVVQLPGSDIANGAEWFDML